MFLTLLSSRTAADCIVCTWDAENRLTKVEQGGTPQNGHTRPSTSATGGVGESRKKSGDTAAAGRRPNTGSSFMPAGCSCWSSTAWTKALAHYWAWTTEEPTDSRPAPGRSAPPKIRSKSEYGDGATWEKRQCLKHNMLCL